jgi:hypothetical protein
LCFIAAGNSRNREPCSAPLHSRRPPSWLVQEESKSPLPRLPSEWEDACADDEVSTPLLRIFAIRSSPPRAVVVVLGYHGVAMFERRACKYCERGASACTGFTIYPPSSLGSISYTRANWTSKDGQTRIAGGIVELVWSACICACVGLNITHYPVIQPRGWQFQGIRVESCDSRASVVFERSRHSPMLLYATETEKGCSLRGSRCRRIVPIDSRDSQSPAAADCLGRGVLRLPRPSAAVHEWWREW